MEGEKLGNLLVALACVLICLAASCAVQATTTTTTTQADGDPAREITKRVNEVVCTVLTFFVYISAGLAALMIMFAGVKFLTSGDDSQARSGAKNMIYYSFSGLIVVLMACPFVDYLVTDTGITPFKESCNCVGGGLSGPDGSTTTTTSSTTSTTGANALTAAALVSCINAAGQLYTDTLSCPDCDMQFTVFKNQPDGEDQYTNHLNKVIGVTGNPCGAIPCWVKGSEHEAGVHTFAELNTFYGCGLV